MTINEKFWNKVAIRFFLVFIASNIVGLLRIYTGFCWLRRRTRNRFVPFYLHSVTYYQCQAVFIIQVINEFFFGAFSHVFFIQVCIMVIYYCSNVLCMKVHMGYIDDVHFAKNDLARDRQILERYKLLLLE